MASPFEVLKQIRHSYKLKLPDLIKVHPVFHTEKLYKHSNNPLPRQPMNNTPPLAINDQIEYKVEQILTIKLVWNKLKYRVKWKGWNNDPN
jgi:hypothetical protein